jgi:hypothetical protein
MDMLVEIVDLAILFSSVHTMHDKVISILAFPYAYAHAPSHIRKSRVVLPSHQSHARLHLPASPRNVSLL